MSGLNPGQMRHVIRIDKRSSDQDAAGEPVLTWSPFAPPVRAQLEVVPGREIWSSAERQGRVPTIFRIRYLPGVVPSMRLIHRRDDLEKVYDIISAIDPDGLRVELVLNCEELVEVAP